MNVEFRAAERVTDLRCVCAACGCAAEGNVTSDGEDICDACASDDSTKCVEETR